MPFDFNAVLRPFLKQASRFAVDFSQQVIREGLIARTIPIEGLSATSDQRYYLVSTIPAFLAAWQAYVAKGGRAPQQALATASGFGTAQGATAVLPADPRASGDMLLIVLPNDVARAGERMLGSCGFQKVAFVRARYVRGQRGRRIPNEVWAWVG